MLSQMSNIFVKINTTISEILLLMWLSFFGIRFARYHVKITFFDDSMSTTCCCDNRFWGCYKPVYHSHKNKKKNLPWWIHNGKSSRCLIRRLKQPKTCDEWVFLSYCIVSSREFHHGSSHKKWPYFRHPSGNVKWHNSH